MHVCRCNLTPRGDYNFFPVSSIHRRATMQPYPSRGLQPLGFDLIGVEDGDATLPLAGTATLSDPRHRRFCRDATLPLAGTATSPLHSNTCETVDATLPLAGTTTSTPLSSMSMASDATLPLAGTTTFSSQDLM